MKSRGSHVIAFALLAMTALLAHGWCLTDERFLDDHWHDRQFDALGWSWNDLIETCTIEPAGFIKLWWQDKTVLWRYARPLWVLLAKTVHVLTGGSVVAQHAVSLGLHIVCSTLVYILALKLTGSRFWSWVGGLLFVVYSHAVFAVAWIAAQNTLLQTTLSLAALLAYLQASGLRLSSESPHSTNSPANSPAGHETRLRSGWFGAAVMFFAASLLSRENAIVLPLILVAVDIAFGGWNHVRRRIGTHILLFSLAGAYLYWRGFVLHHPLPDVYCRRYDGPGYLLWAGAKLLHYLTSSVWLSPMVIGPTGRINPIREVPGDCVLMLVILGVMGSGYYLACRKIVGFWIWPLWILLSVLPVVPVMATPHSGYMAGVGFAVAMVLGPALRHRFPAHSIGRWSPGVALWFLIATCTYVPIYRDLWNGMRAAEAATLQGLAAKPLPRTVTDVFYLNLPFVNIYAPVQMEQSSGSVDPAPRHHVLIFAPNVLEMNEKCSVEQLDDHRLAVSVEGKPYFSGLLGRFLLEGMRESTELSTGTILEAEPFVVERAEGDEQGVRRIIFRFSEPLWSDHYRFYITTEKCPAAVLPILPSKQGLIEANCQDSSVEPLKRIRDELDRLHTIRAVTARIIRTDLYLSGPAYPGPR